MIPAAANNRRARVRSGAASRRQARALPTRTTTAALHRTETVAARAPDGQAGMTNLAQRDRSWSDPLDALDDDFYSQSLEEITNASRSRHRARELSTASCTETRTHLSGARSRRCLSLQLHARGGASGGARRARSGRKASDVLARRYYNGCVRHLRERRSCAPRSCDRASTRTPALVCTRRGTLLRSARDGAQEHGRLARKLNTDASRDCASPALRGTCASSAAVAPVFAQMQEARWRINNVQQRFDTTCACRRHRRRQRHFSSTAPSRCAAMVLRGCERLDCLNISRASDAEIHGDARGTFELT